MDENSILDPGQVYETNGDHCGSPPDAPPPLPPSPVSGGPHRKKSSSFQITKVQYPRRGSNDCGDDSNDDSHTEDTSDITDSVDQQSDTSAVILQNPSVDSLASRFTVVRTTDSTENTHSYKRGRWLIEDNYQDDQVDRDVKGVFVPRSPSHMEENQEPVNVCEDVLADVPTAASNSTNAEPVPMVGNVNVADVSRFNVQSAEASNTARQGCLEGLLPSVVEDVRIHDVPMQAYPQQPVSYPGEPRQKRDEHALPGQNIVGVSHLSGQNQFQQQSFSQLATGNAVYQSAPPGVTCQGLNQPIGTGPPSQNIGHQPQADPKSHHAGSTDISGSSFVSIQPVSNAAESCAPMSQQYQPSAEIPPISYQNSNLGQQPAFKTANTTSTANVVTVSSRTDYNMQTVGLPGYGASGLHQTLLNTYQNNQVASLPPAENTQAGPTQVSYGVAYPLTNHGDPLPPVTSLGFNQQQPVQQSFHRDASGISQIQASQSQNEIRDTPLPYSSDTRNTMLATEFQSQVSISGLGIGGDAIAYHQQGSAVAPSGASLQADQMQFVTQNFQKSQVTPVPSIQNVHGISMKSVGFSENLSSAPVGQMQSQSNLPINQHACNTPYQVSTGQNLPQTSTQMVIAKTHYGVPPSSISTAVITESYNQPSAVQGASVPTYQDPGIIQHGALNSVYSHQITQHQLHNAYASSSSVGIDGSLSPTKVSNLKRNEQQQHLELKTGLANIIPTSVGSQQLPLGFQAQQGNQRFTGHVSQPGEQPGFTQSRVECPEIADNTVIVHATASQQAGIQSGHTTVGESYQTSARPQPPSHQQAHQPSMVQQAPQSVQQTVLQNPLPFVQQQGQQLLFQQQQNFGLYTVPHTNEPVYGVHSSGFKSEGGILQQAIYHDESAANQLTVKTSDALSQAQPVSQVLSGPQTGAYQQEASANVNKNFPSLNQQQQTMQEVHPGHVAFLPRESSSVSASHSGSSATMTSPQPQLSHPGFPNQGISQPVVRSSQSYQPSSQFSASIQGQLPAGSQPPAYPGVSYTTSYSAAGQALHNAGQSTMPRGNQLQSQASVHGLQSLSTAPVTQTATLQQEQPLQSSQGPSIQNFAGQQGVSSQLPQQIQSASVGPAGVSKDVPSNNLQPESRLPQKPPNLHLVLPQTASTSNTFAATGTEIPSSFVNQLPVQGSVQYPSQAVQQFHPQGLNQQSIGNQQQPVPPVVQPKTQQNLSMPVHGASVQQSSQGAVQHARAPSALSQQLEGQSVQPILQAALQIQGQVLSLDFSDSAAGGNSVAIDNRIVQALDIVKDRLIHAVREEVDELKLKIEELNLRIRELESENSLLRGAVPTELLAQIDSQKAGAGQN